MVAGALVVGGAGGTAWYVSTADGCGAGFDVVDVSGHAPLLVPVAEAAAVPDPEAADEAAQLIEVGAPFGPVVAAGTGIFEPLDVPPVATGYGAVLLTSRAEGLLEGASDGALVALDLPDGAVRWAIRFTGDVPEHVVAGDRLVLLSVTADTAPEVVAIDLAAGRVVGCTRVGGALDRGTPPHGIVAVGADVVVLHQREPADDEPTVSRAPAITRLDPATGARRWTTDLPGEIAGPLHVLGDVVVLDELRDLSDAGLEPPEAMGYHATTLPGTGVVAFSLGDGAPAWSVTGPDEVHRVVGVSGDVVVLERAREADPALERTLLGVDASGTEAWRRDLPAHDVGLSQVRGDAVTWWQEDEPVVLHAWSAAAGTDLWTLEGEAVYGLRYALPDLDVVGGAWVTRYSGTGLQVVDPATGDWAVHVRPDGYWRSTEVGDHVLTELLDGLVLFERR